MAQRQLNIRSDEAATLAAILAERLGTTTTNVVVEALRAYKASVEPPGSSDLTPEQRREYDALRSLSRQTAKHKEPGTASDHAWLYDEHGLPT
jgi:hypothetical protein